MTESINMIRADMRDIPRFPPPEGFSIRAMRRDEGALWADIQRDAGTIGADDHDAFGNAFGEYLPATESRCFFVLASSGAAVGTVSAWFSREFRGLEWGRIHWVAVRPALHGKKLGKAAVSHAMEYLAAHHDRAWLDTQTYRPIAVRLYLEFGFRPDLEPPGALEAWRAVAAKLDHPALAGLR